MLPDSKKTELGISGQKTSLAAVKNTGVVLVPCCVWECFLPVISVGVDISKVPGCHLLRKMSSH